MNPVIDRVFEAVARVDTQLNLKFLSASGKAWFGSTAPATGEFLESVHDEDKEVLLNCLAGSPQQFSVYIRLIADGVARWAAIRATRIDPLNQYMLCILDVSEFKVQDSALVHAAEHDALTKLPNRVKISEVIDDHIYDDHKGFVVALLDLDGFKKVNDTMGHHAGDVVLIEVAKRLMKCIDKTTDLAARLGGDEFVLVLYGNDLENRANAVLDKVLFTLARPFNTEPYEAYIGCSIGVSVYPENGVSGADLLKAADSAMYFSKRNGKNQITQYVKAQEQNDLEIKAALHRGIEDGEFHMAYQPVYTADGQIVGAEALMRWESSSVAKVNTENFIRIAEETGLIQYLGEWALKYSCMQLLEFQKLVPNFVVSVNVSPMQFHDKGFLYTVKNCVADTGVDPSTLVLEITESCLMNSNDDVLTCLTALRDEGILLSVDDFGTGFSSLSYLTRLPVKSMKIDRSFVWATTKADASEADRACSKRLLKAMVNLAHCVELRCVAEGVETQEQLNYIKEIGCDLVQGYLLGKPMVYKDMLEFLKRD